MQFILIGRDAKDKEALGRRMAARADHFKLMEEGIAAGRNVIAAAMLNDNGDMCGSVMIVNFEDRAALDRWLESEPYMTQGVWKDVEIIPCKIPPQFGVKS